MNHVACIASVCPIRKEPSHTSEMVSQILFAEFAEVLEVQKQFTKVRCIYDCYEGWCQNSQLTDVDLSAALTNHLYTIGFTTSVLLNGSEMNVSFATPVRSRNDDVHFGKYVVNYRGCAVWDAQTGFNEQHVRDIAYRYLNVPYLWGGRSVFGIDCSGFSQQVFKMFNIKLPRDAYQQAELGEEVSFLQSAICGDLAFFDNDEGRITHVGILLYSSEIIHASGRVRVDKIDNAGIINNETGVRTHKLRMIKRYKKT